MRPWEEAWEFDGEDLVLPDGRVCMHVEDEPDQIVTERRVILPCEERAKLAAAAPKLYRTLERVSILLDRFTFGPTYLTLDDAVAALTAANAVLREARGEDA